MTEPTHSPYTDIHSLAWAYVSGLLNETEQESIQLELLHNTELAKLLVQYSVIWQKREGELTIYSNEDIQKWKSQVMWPSDAIYVKKASKLDSLFKPSAKNLTRLLIIAIAIALITIFIVSI